MRTQSIALIAMLAIGLLQIGCQSSAVTATGKAQLFAMDNMNSGFDHVWVTIEKIEFTKADASTVTVFDHTSTGGNQVDLLSLHDGLGHKFRLLSGFDAVPGDFTGINITLASTLNVFTTGATTATAATFEGATGATFVMSLAFPTQTLGADSDFVVDFDLANWTLTPGTPATISATDGAFLKLGVKTDLDDRSRHCESGHDGTVSALAGTSPVQTFTITDGDESIDVVTSAATTITNSDGSTNPDLANGQNVEVNGTFDTTNNVLIATSITIRKGNETHGDRLHGIVTSFDATAHTITVAVQDADGFLPDTTRVTITVDANTVYFSAPGITDTQDEFFAALVANTTIIAARGVLTGSTLAATRLHVIDEGTAHDHDGNAVVRGIVSNAVTTEGVLTFDIAVSDCEGVRFDITKTVHVVTTADTTYKIAGSSALQADFAAALTSTSVVSVRGTLDTSTMTLTAIAVSTGSITL